jgi:uncharacterized membrane protein YheB (UPF0754 family)
MTELSTLHIISIPIISAFIGWLTNYIAIQSLFRPLKPKKILFFTLWGVIPKRQKNISKKLAEVVQEYLFSHEDLIELLTKEENIDKIKKKILPILKDRILGKIPSMFRGMAEPFIEELLSKEIDDVLMQINVELAVHLEDTVDVKKIVYEKLINYDVSQLEKIIRQIANKELKHIEYLGGVIGFVVGIIQILIIGFI